MTLFDAWGAGGVNIDTPVITPRVPSAPIKSCLRSYPGIMLRTVSHMLEYQERTCVVFTQRCQLVKYCTVW